jgi:hypothetical protein
MHLLVSAILCRSKLDCGADLRGYLRLGGGDGWLAGCCSYRQVHRELVKLGVAIGPSAARRTDPTGPST